MSSIVSSASVTSIKNNARKTVLSLNFNLSSEEIYKHTENIIKKHEQNLLEIVKCNNISFESFKQFANAQADAVIQSSQATLPALISTDKDAREASSKSKAKLRETFQDVFTKQDLFLLLKNSYSKAISATDNNVTLSDEDRRFMEKTLNSFSASGLGNYNVSTNVIDEAKVAKYTKLNKECGIATNKYEQNINENTDSIYLTKDELAGCANSFIDSLTQDDGKEKYEISMKAPVRIPVMQYASDPETRKKVKQVADSRCIDTNGNLLKDILKLRMEKAKVLGFDSHADFILKEKMIKTQDNARTFLLDIFDRLKPKLQQDIDLLLNEKKNDLNIMEDEKSVLKSWDISYYSRIYKEKYFSLDSERIREYFPLQHVQKAIFEIYQEFLSVKFEKVEHSTNNVWHESVEMYEVIDCDSNEVCGHFYLDLFSRDGKFGHQCVVPLVPSCNFNGEKILPAVSILGNMTKPTDTRPSLLRFAEVHTFFHEFGHVMHAVLSNTGYTRFSWTWPMMPWIGGVEQDFLEVPSMFLEKLVYEKWCIEKLSSHYKTGETLDKKSIENLNKAQHFLSGIRWSRFIAMALYDLDIHSQDIYGTDHNRESVYHINHGGLDGSFNLNDLWEEMMSKIAFQGNKYEVENTFMPASWYHLVIGYDAGYYGYLYSEVYAYEILNEVQQSHKHGGFDGLKSIGKRYRSKILEPCATIDGFDMLENFLQKKPSSNGFLKALNL